MMTSASSLSHLPDFPAIKKLASALFGSTTSHHGVAIMIGAGFSRCGANHVGGRKKMPLWPAFTRSLAGDLYPTEQDLSFIDPLRVAEEFRVFFGQTALNDRIRSEIEDEAWLVGPLYSALLTLPWAEVLTTNWDTLLERAAKAVHSPYYTPVTKASDLAWARSPRIIKLHGTIGVTDHFVAAQEDYRTYPEKFAPFVNLARQIFIENELCLLGFSGDDPNFLQWAGWVRDHLASHARRIYLVGALRLSAARRKQLESINVAPVDLWPAVAQIEDTDLRHTTAIEMFLRALNDQSAIGVTPHEWTPTLLTTSQTDPDAYTRILRDASLGANTLAGQLETLARDRESYPGWIVCPPGLRWSLAHQITQPPPNAENISALDFDVRAKLLYEIAWRHSVTLTHIPRWLADKLFEIATTDQRGSITRNQQLEIALTLLNNCRWDGLDSVNDFTEDRIRKLTDLLIKNALYLPDCAAHIANFHALTARDRLDYDGLSKAIKKIEGEDPIWMLRKAAFLMELGQSEEGVALIAEAYGKLRDAHRNDRMSIPILSRLLWSYWLVAATKSGRSDSKEEELPIFVESNYRKWRCDPWSWIEDLRDRIREREEDVFKRRNPIEPQFDQGHYRDHSSRTADKIDVSCSLLLDGLSSVCGIPLRFESRGINVGLLSGDAERLILSGGSGSAVWDLTLAIRSAHAEDARAIKEVFSRVSLACASQPVIDVLVANVSEATSFWVRALSGAQRGCSIAATNKLRVFLAVLARLVVRMTPSKAKEHFSLAADFGSRAEMQDPWLSEVIGLLLANSLKSIPTSEQGELLPIALDFPLRNELAQRGLSRWPNPVVNHVFDRHRYPSINARISYLIDIIERGEDASKRDGLARLFPLVTKTGFLTRSEQLSIANAVWHDDPTFSTLPRVGLLPHALLTLPSTDAKKIRRRIRDEIYVQVIEFLDDAAKETRVYPSKEAERAISTLWSIAYAAEGQGHHMFPTAKQASVLFETLTAWRPRKAADHKWEFSKNEERQVAEGIGHALSYAIVPALRAEMRSDTSFTQLETFLVDVTAASSVLPALVYFVGVSEACEKASAKHIQAFLRSRNSSHVRWSVIALERWTKISGSRLSRTLVKLLSLVISMIESERSFGLHHVLWLARRLAVFGVLSKEQKSILMEVVPRVFKYASYENIELLSFEAVTASTVRAECFRLAQILSEWFPKSAALNDLLREAQEDPLPEVRFASIQDN